MHILRLARGCVNQTRKYVYNQLNELFALETFFKDVFAPLQILQKIMFLKCVRSMIFLAFQSKGKLLQLFQSELCEKMMY